MIQYQKTTLDNGLRIIVHTDNQTPVVYVGVLYEVGTKHEDLQRTGFAHLFEHLMFGGSAHAPNYDQLLQRAGGDNNAYTSSDHTFYHANVPPQNLPLLLWLEADRMKNLNLNAESLAVQQKVVIEEFKETCLEQPYGDVWHHLLDLSYTVHPYKIPTIGLTFEHIQEASLEDAQAFYRKFYRPSNAILVVCGPCEAAEVFELAQTYFGCLEDQPQPRPLLPEEPPISQMRRRQVKADVPVNAIYLSFLAANRLERAFYLEDVLCDYLSGGESSWLYRRMVKELELFVELDVYITASDEKGLFIIDGRLAEGIGYEEGEAALWQALQTFTEQGIKQRNLDKIVHQALYATALNNVSCAHKLAQLAAFESLGQLDLINTELKIYQELSVAEVNAHAKTLFRPEACAVLWYGE